MQYLSRNDIEEIARRIVDQYKQAYIPDQHMCYNVDIIKFASLMGYEVEYVHITKDGSILGKTSSGQIWTRIYDDKMNELYYLLDGHTILVDKRLLSSPTISTPSRAILTIWLCVGNIRWGGMRFWDIASLHINLLTNPQVCSMRSRPRVFFFAIDLLLFVGRSVASDINWCESSD